MCSVARVTNGQRNPARTVWFQSLRYLTTASVNALKRHLPSVPASFFLCDDNRERDLSGPRLHPSLLQSTLIIIIIPKMIAGR